MQKRMTAAETHEIAGNTSTGVLKLIAMVFMFCDHAGKMLCSNMPEMRALGRIAFPLYAWCIVVGFCYTHSVPKYLLRMILVGLVSQVIYMPALNHTWTEPNVFLTLVIAVLGLWGLREKKWGSHIWAPVLALAAAIMFGADYGWKGVLFIFLLYACRGSRPALAAVMIAFCLYWGVNTSTVSSFFGLRLPLNDLITAQLIGPWTKLQSMAVFALPLILWRCPAKLKLPKLVGYAIYPLHLLILLDIELLVGQTDWAGIISHFIH